MVLVAVNTPCQENSDCNTNGQCHMGQCRCKLGFSGDGNKTCVGRSRSKSRSRAWNHSLLCHPSLGKIMLRGNVLCVMSPVNNLGETTFKEQSHWSENLREPSKSIYSLGFRWLFAPVWMALEYNHNRCLFKVCKIVTLWRYPRFLISYRWQWVWTIHKPM